MVADDGMKKADIDPERLAALLDKRLDARERDALVAQLAASDDATLDALADAIAVTHELGQTDETGRAATPAIDPRRASRRWLLAAAAILVIAAVPWAWTRLAPQRPAAPEQLVAQLADAQLPADWNAAPWSARRGGEAMSPRALAVRVGSRSVDRGVAMRRGDARASDIAREIATLLAGVAGGAPAAAAYASLATANAGTAAADDARDAWQLALPLLDARYAELGAWLEAARFAVARQDAEFFSRRESTAVRTRALAIDDLPAETRALLEALSAPSARTPDWTALRVRVDAALGAAGS
jgi:hypothetical protein